MSGSGARRIGRPVDLAVRVIVVIVALVSVTLAAHGAYRSTLIGAGLFDSTRTGDEAIAQQNQYGYETIRRQLAASVPAGSKVYYLDPTGEWQQRIVEFATMYGIVVVDTQAEANYRLLVQGAPPVGNSGGVTLVVERIR